MPGLRLHINRVLALFTRPKSVFTELAASRDLGPAAVAWVMTSLLFAATSVTARAHDIPLTAKPIVALADYRLVQAAAMPFILAAGCLLGTAGGYLVGRLFYCQKDFQSLLAVCAPAVLVALWPIFWPTEMAHALGFLDAGLPGFPGFWIRELAPALTVLYMLFQTLVACWEAQRLLLRESFASAVVVVLSVLGFWALLLR